MRIWGPRDVWSQGSKDMRMYVGTWGHPQTQQESCELALAKDANNMGRR